MNAKAKTTKNQVKSAVDIQEQREMVEKVSTPVSFCPKTPTNFDPISSVNMRRLSSCLSACKCFP